MGTPLRRGRDFTDRDTQDALPVVIINNTLAERTFPGETPIGRQLELFLYGETMELEVIGVSADTRFAGLDQATRDVLNHGERLTELLKQNQFSPQSLGEQIVVLFSASKIDDVPTSDVQRFEAELLEYIRNGHADIIESVNETFDLSDEIKSKLDSAVDSFKAAFQAS